MLIPTLYPSQHPGDRVLEVTGLTGGPVEHPLFSDLDLCLPPGVCALLGDEGAGKTSLLRLLSGDLVARSGQMRLLGVESPLCTPQPGAVYWSDLRLPLHDEDTPVQCWAALATQWPAWSEDTQKALVCALQLTPHLDKCLNMLSTGSRRKVGLVAALASGATVTLLDQPFVSLDQTSIRVLQDILSDTCRDPQRTCLIADYEKPAHLPLAAVLQL